ncbi:MAG: flagellar motor switch protein FliN [Planctomycetales bacterium]
MSEELRDASFGSTEDAGEAAVPQNSGQSPERDAARNSPASAADVLDLGEIDALVGTAARRHAVEEGDAQRRETERLLDQAEADLAAAVAAELRPLPEDARPYEFDRFETGATLVDSHASLQSLEDVELDLQIELGRTELLIEEVLKLKAGSVVPLDKLAGDPVDVLVNGRLVARGEVLVLNDNFCVRIAEILSPDF